MTGKFFGLIACLCLMAQISVNAQVTDTARTKRQPREVVTEEGVFKDSARLAIEAMPGIAARRSAILPGLGQIYNRRWWKVPLVYGGYFGIGLVYEFNQRQYKIFLKEAQYRQEDPSKVNPLFKPYTNEGIISLKDDYRRVRDLSILAGVAFHAIQVIDAYIDAKFYRFDVSNDLSFNVVPVMPSGNNYFAAKAVKPLIGFNMKLSL